MTTSESYHTPQPDIKQTWYFGEQPVTGAAVMCSSRRAAEHVSRILIAPDIGIFFFELPDGSDVQDLKLASFLTDWSVIYIWPSSQRQSQATMNWFATRAYALEASVFQIDTPRVPHNLTDDHIRDAYKNAMPFTPSGALTPAKIDAANNNSDIQAEMQQIFRLNTLDLARRYLPALAKDFLISDYTNDKGQDVSKVRVVTPQGIWREPVNDLLSNVAETIGRDAQLVFDGNLPEKLKMKELAFLSRSKGKELQEVVNHFMTVRYMWVSEKHECLKDLTIEKERDFDANTRYLGAPNGVIDLDTGALLTGKEARETLTTRMIPDAYNPDAQHDDVDLLFDHIPSPDKEWLIDALAYALKGRPSRRFYYLLGEDGGEGKGTVLEAVKACIGEYGATIPRGALEKKRSLAGGLSAELEFATTARLAIQNEQRAYFADEDLMKTISGDDTIKWRGLYKGFGIDRRSSATMIFAVNSIPKLSFTDKALADRVRILRYPKPPDIDKKLRSRLIDNAECRQALLALLVRRAAQIDEPPDDTPSVAEENAKAKMDYLGEAGQWLSDVIVEDYAGEFSTRELWEAAKAHGRDKPETEFAMARKRQWYVENAKLLHNMPSPFRLGGSKGFGWKGWRLATADEGKDEPMNGTLTPREYDTMLVDNVKDILAEPLVMNEVVSYSEGASGKLELNNIQRAVSRTGWNIVFRTPLETEDVSDLLAALNITDMAERNYKMWDLGFASEETDDTVTWQPREFMDWKLRGAE